MRLEETFGKLGIRPRGRKHSNVRDSFRLPQRIPPSVDDEIYTKLKRNRNVRVKQFIHNLLRNIFRMFKSMGRIFVPKGSHKIILNPSQMSWSLGSIPLFCFLFAFVFIFRTRTFISNISIERGDHFFQDSISIGRFLSPSRPFQSHQNYFDDDYFESYDYTTRIPDYGDLSFTFIDANAEQAFARQIKPEPNMFHGHVWADDEYESNQFDDAYYALDDDHVRSTSFTDINLKCRRPAFHRMYHPNCNSFHELFLKEGKYLGEGTYREAYLLHERFDPNVVIKVQRFQDNDFELDRYEFVRIDALVMERLSASPRIADMYGHCATSVNTEFLPDELYPLMIPGQGMGNHMNDTVDVDPQNNFTITEKLDLAIRMAESIADLHGYKGGVLIHDDLQVFQWLFGPDGTLKLNDFNRAEAMLFDEETGEYCRYHNGHIGGEFRAPEEIVDGLLNEKIDVYSFGNHIYGLLTGLWVYYEMKTIRAKPKMKKIEAGILPYVDPRYRNRNYVQDRLLSLMEQCWKFDPDDRVDIFTALQYLRETKKEAIKMGFYDEKYVHLHFQDWPISDLKS